MPLGTALERHIDSQCLSRLQVGLDSEPKSHSNRESVRFGQGLGCTPYPAPHWSNACPAAIPC
jgi:hypothetical protein